MADIDLVFEANRQAIAEISNSDEVRAGLELIGQIGEQQAKIHAPVDTGNLRRSITHEVGRDFRGLFVRFGTNVFYGVYQELGTRHMPAHPFLRPALEYIRRNVFNG